MTDRWAENQRRGKGHFDRDVKKNEKLKLIKLKIRFIAILLDIIYLMEGLKFLLNHVMFLFLLKICDIFPFTKY